MAVPACLIAQSSPALPFPPAEPGPTGALVQDNVLSQAERAAISKATHLIPSLSGELAFWLQDCGALPGCTVGFEDEVSPLAAFFALSSASKARLRSLANSSACICLLHRSLLSNSLI